MTSCFRICHHFLSVRVHLASFTDVFFMWVVSHDVSRRHCIETVQFTDVSMLFFCICHRVTPVVRSVQDIFHDTRVVGSFCLGMSSLFRSSQACV